MDLQYLGSDESSFGSISYHEFGILPKRRTMESTRPNWNKKYRSEPIRYKKKEGLSTIPRRPNTVYRGMSYQEYKNALRKGYFKSRGSYNIGVTQEGSTCGSTDPTTAMQYASSFAPLSKKPTPEEPGVVVAFRETPRWKQNVQMTGSETERQHTGPIPISDIKEVYIFQMQEFIPSHMEIWKEYGKVRTGSRGTPIIKGTWKRIK